MFTYHTACRPGSSGGELSVAARGQPHGRQSADYYGAASQYATAGSICGAVRAGAEQYAGSQSGVDVYLPKSGSTLVVPQQVILPDTVREGIVINVAEMRLYYYPKDSNTVEILPIGIGQAGRETPRNWVTTVQRKQEAPSWTPTANTRREYAARGESLPAFVPAGPENPMGLYAIYIGKLYAIHGTNANFGIGLRVSGAVFACAMTILNTCLIPCRWERGFNLSTGLLNTALSQTVAAGLKFMNRCHATAANMSRIKDPTAGDSGITQFCERRGSGRQSC